MVEFPNIESFVGLFILIVVGSVMMLLRESGAREERKRQERMQEAEEMLDDFAKQRVRSLEREQQRRRKLLAEMPEERRKLYEWKEIAEANDLESPKRLVEFYVEIGQILEKDKAEMLLNVEAAWDEAMQLPPLES